VAGGGFRPDLRDVGTYGREWPGSHGFHHTFSAPLPIVPNGEKVLAGWKPLQAILVIALGRSGTTLLMSRLSLSSQICIADMHPFEVRRLSYWSTVVGTLAGEADFERSMHPDRLEADGFKVGANPFAHPDYVDVFQTKELEAEYFRTYVPGQLQDIAHRVIEEY
jgi:hypothetical protein